MKATVTIYRDVYRTVTNLRNPLIFDDLTSDAILLYVFRNGHNSASVPLVPERPTRNIVATPLEADSAVGAMGLPDQTTASLSSPGPDHDLYVDVGGSAGMRRKIDARVVQRARSFHHPASLGPLHLPSRKTFSVQ